MQGPAGGTGPGVSQGSLTAKGGSWEMAGYPPSLHLTTSHSCSGTSALNGPRSKPRFICGSLPSWPRDSTNKALRRSAVPHTWYTGPTASATRQPGSIGSPAGEGNTLLGQVRELSSPDPCPLLPLRGWPVCSHLLGLVSSPGHLCHLTTSTACSLASLGTPEAMAPGEQAPGPSSLRRGERLSRSYGAHGEAPAGFPRQRA